MWVVKFNNSGVFMTASNSYFMGTDKTTSIYQNPNYFSGVSSTSLALTSGGQITAASLFDEKFLERKDNYNQTRDSYNTARAGRDAAINTKISNIVSYIENGKEGKAMDEYAKLLEEMSNQNRYAQLKHGDDDTQLRAVARHLIETNAEVNLEKLIKDNCDTSFERGFKVSFEDKTYTQEDMLKEMCDLDEKNKLTDLKRGAGNACRISTCAATGAGIGFFIGGGPLGAVIGGGIGAIVGGIGCAF